MFIPKWVLVILFLISVGSTVGLLFVLTQRSIVQSNGKPSASTTIVVQSSGSPSPKIDQSSSSASPLSATAEWKKYKFDALSLSLEYPADWKVSSTNSAELILANFDGDKLPENDQKNIQIVVTRKKKVSTSAKLSGYLDDRLKELKKTYPDASVLSETKKLIDDYDAIDRVYSLGSESLKSFREITFATRSYYYIINVSPTDSTLSPVADEVFKTIKII